MEPRIRPLNREEIEPSLLELSAFQRSGQPTPFNIYRTLAYHPAMVRQWLGFADALRFAATLSARDRELLILRTGVNCKCEYEWGQHVPYARSGGVTDEELRALLDPIDQHPWANRDEVLLRAADELHAQSQISDETWARLVDEFDSKGLIEVVMLVGQYHLVSYVLNGFRVQRDEGLAPFPQDL